MPILCNNQSSYFYSYQCHFAHFSSSNLTVAFLPSTFPSPFIMISFFETHIHSPFLQVLPVKICLAMSSAFRYFGTCPGCGLEKFIIVHLCAGPNRRVRPFEKSRFLALPIPRTIFHMFPAAPIALKWGVEAVWTSFLSHLSNSLQLQISPLSSFCSQHRTRSWNIRWAEYIWVLQMWNASDALSQCLR